MLTAHEDNTLVATMTWEERDGDLYISSINSVSPHALAPLLARFRSIHKGRTVHFHARTDNLSMARLVVLLKAEETSRAYCVTL